MSDQWTQDDIDHEMLSYEEDEDAWAELMCHLHPDGQCGAAGSEYCEFECPFRNDKA